MIEISSLKRIPRFSGVSTAALEWLSERLHRRRFDRKMPIFQDGDPCTSLLLIEVGSVKVVKTLESGRELILNIFRTGESVGEVALIDGTEFPASAWAQENTIILELSRDHYFEMAKKFPEILMATIRDLNFRVRSLTQRVQELGSGDVEARLARFFLAMAKNAKLEKGGARIDHHLSRQELADIVGVRIETVIRLMSRWQKESIVETREDGFFIPELHTLESIIEKSY